MTIKEIIKDCVDVLAEKGDIEVDYWSAVGDIYKLTD